jgi:enoyl-CoA hydratase
MPHTQESDEDGIRILTLASGKANALHPPVVEELLAAVRRATADASARGLVLASGLPRFFSAGFDVGSVFQLDRPSMREFFGSFIDLYEELLSSPKPVVAAINGHAVAGGAVLALMADQRVFAAGDSRFALMEVDIGVELPPKPTRLMTAAAGWSAASEILLGGASLKPERALAVGLATEVVSPECVLSRAVARCAALASKPPGAFAAIKRGLHTAAGIADRESDRQHLDRFLEQWFSAESVAARNALAASLRR